MPNKMYGYSDEKSWQRFPIKNEGRILGGIYTSPRKGDVDSPPSMGVEWGLDFGFGYDSRQCCNAPHSPRIRVLLRLWIRIRVYALMPTTKMMM